jgi:hypothetical protein
MSSFRLPLPVVVPALSASTTSAHQTAELRMRARADRWSIGLIIASESRR